MSSNALTTAAEWAALETLNPWPRNPRVNAQAIEAVARAITDMGWGAPIVAQASTRMIMAGHTRRLAAIRLTEWFAIGRTVGWHADALRVGEYGEVPVRFVDCDDRTAERLALADNRLGEIAAWDDRMLLDVLKDYDEATADTLGWKPTDLDALIDRVNADVAAATAPASTHTVREHERTSRGESKPARMRALLLRAVDTGVLPLDLVAEIEEILR